MKCVRSCVLWATRWHWCWRVQCSSAEDSVCICTVCILNWVYFNFIVWIWIIIHERSHLEGGREQQYLNEMQLLWRKEKSCCLSETALGKRSARCGVFDGFRLFLFCIFPWRMRLALGADGEWGQNCWRMLIEFHELWILSINERCLAAPTQRTTWSNYDRWDCDAQLRFSRLMRARGAQRARWRNNYHIEFMTRQT